MPNKPYNIIELEKILDYYIQNKKFETPNRIFCNKVLAYSSQESFCFSTPWTISWQIISQCNLRCKHCFFENNQDFYKGKEDLNIKLLQKLVKEIAKLGTVAVSITGGEPFLCKKIFDLLKELKNNNIIISIQTNATLIDKTIAQNLKDILNPYTDFIQVSLDGSCPNIYDQIRGQGMYKKALKGIEYLLNNELNLNINTTAVSTNKDDLFNIYKLCNNLGIKKYSISKFLPYCKEQNFLNVNFSSLIKPLSKIIDISNQNFTFFEMNYKFYDFLKDEQVRKDLDKILNLKENKFLIDNDITCHKHNTLYINSKGNIYLCFACENEIGCLGKYPDKPLEEIWKNRKNNIFFKKRFAQNVACVKCKYFNYCKSGCMGYAQKFYGDINAPDGYCEYAKLIKLI